jgi:hypothetical protein
VNEVKRAFAWLSLGLAGCSAIVAPDTTRLGGGGGVDAHVAPGTDAAVDAFVDPAVDAFAPACPGACDDGNPCTVDRCVTGACASVPGDDDRDGFGDAACGGDDCDDTSAEVSPGVAERCGNGLDDDCNPATVDGCTTTLPDRCESAQVIDLSTGSATVRGDFGPLAADYDTFCIDGGGRGADAVYVLDPGPMRAVDLRIETVGDVDTVLSVSSTCGEFRLPACNDDQRPGGDANARVWVHPAVGRLYLLVSAFDAASGPYEVRLTASPLAANECGGSSLDVTDGGTVVGVALPPARATGACMPTGSRGLLETPMHFDGDRIDRLRVYSLFDATVHVRADGCDPAAEVACERSSPIGGGGTFTDTNVRSDASRLHLFVDGATSSDQVYALFVEP